MSIVVVGLGPAGLDRIDALTRSVLFDPATEVIVRTRRHPASEELGMAIDVTFCDDLYERHEAFDAVYDSIARRVIDAGVRGRVVYGVPGSPIVGERTVPMIVSRASAAGIDVEILPAPSFLDLAYAATAIDPITHGAQIVDARDLPDPLPLHLPTFVTQVDSQLRAGDVAIALGRTLGDDAEVTVLDRLGDADAVAATMGLDDLARYEAGPRTTVFVPQADVGLLGLIATHRILRAECPWDRDQTHHSLLSHLVEEAYETADAIGHLPMDAPEGEPDFGAYAEVEDELGDLLLQVVFHATMASEAGAFDIDEVAEQNRRKLVRRHPHVFGDVDAADANAVRANWEQIKRSEKSRDSLMDDVPSGMPSIARAMKAQSRAASVGFDWDGPEPVVEVLRAEIDELEEATGDHRAVMDELGDVLFSAINLARHIDVDPEVALRRSADRFMARFRVIEETFSQDGRAISDVPLDELQAAWTAAKATTMGSSERS